MFDLVLGWVKIWRITIYLESGILEYLHLISEPSLPPGYSYIFPSSPPSELLARLHTAKVFGRDDYHLVGLRNMENLLIITSLCLVAKHMKIETNSKACS